ncbi:MAG: hypothetical protein MUC56_06710 [Thermoanaerobaculales bacterium]|jgi:formate hydrogenlyase subunit 3/multisubunit Na+/H+ antiporter MnhD subunit|nr:hypothetical protein [Thermoanaerobaculales bacterium]
MSPDRLLFLLPLVPLLAAVVAFVAPGWSRRAGLAAATAMPPLALWTAMGVLESGMLSLPLGGWTAPLGIALRADGLSAVMVLAVAVVGFFISLHAAASFPGAGVQTHRERFFWPLWLLLLAGLNALFVSGDVFNLYVCLEITGIAAVSLVATAGSPDAIRAALRYLFVSLSGSLFYLMGVAILYGGTGVLDLVLLVEVVAGDPPAIIACLLMTGGLMMKTALFPMHFWLPPAHSSAPAPVSAALSALVVKGGLYILLRLWFGPFADLVGDGAIQWIGGLGAAAIVWGSWQAIHQPRLKLVVAYSTVAQLGYLFLLFPIAWSAADRTAAFTGGVVLLLSHATAKAAVFLAAGNVLAAVGNDRVPSLCGLSRWLPVSAFAMGLAGVALIGLPPSAGFIGKWLLVVAALEQGQWWWVAVLLLGSVLAAVYIIRLLGPAFVMPDSDQPPNPVSRIAEWTAFALAALSVLLGFVAIWPARLLAASVGSGFSP